MAVAVGVLRVSPVVVGTGEVAEAVDSEGDEVVAGADVDSIEEMIELAWDRILLTALGVVAAESEPTLDRKELAWERTPATPLVLVASASRLVTTELT